MDFQAKIKIVVKAKITVNLMHDTIVVIPFRKREEHLRYFMEHS
jgi:hypothetical protein